MANIPRAPKQCCFTSETVMEIKFDVLFALARHTFRSISCCWYVGEKTPKTKPYRVFSNDDENKPEASRPTKEQIVNILELLLGQITNFCPTISRNTIVKNPMSVNKIWQTIRLYFGFQTAGTHFIDFDNIRFERPEDLFQRLTTFVEDNLLRKNMVITHHYETIEDDKELCPSLKHFVVLNVTWLRFLHPGLLKLIKQRYGAELRVRTLASIKHGISQALDSLLEELRTSKEAKSMRMLTNRFQKP